MRRPTRDPYARPAIQTLERLHAELGGKILENRQQGQNLAEQMRQVEAVIKMLERIEHWRQHERNVRR
jgi:hypothetical protein